MQCPYCGRDIPDDARWCPYCGAEQTPPEELQDENIPSDGWQDDPAPPDEWHGEDAASGWQDGAPADDWDDEAEPPDDSWADDAPVPGWEEDAPYTPAPEDKDAPRSKALLIAIFAALGVALIVLLLTAQSFCELSLPAYTSRIVDTGIQSGGIEYAAPLALTDKTMDGVRLFLSDDDAAAVSAAYTEDNGVWTLNDTAQLPELEGIFIRPLVMYARLSEQGANTVLALRQQMQGGLITHEEILARGEEALSGMGTLTDSVLRSAAVQFLKTEYAVAGLNVDHIRNSYLLRTGGKMLLLTLGMIAAACI